MFGKKKISDPPPPVENDQLSTEVLDKHRQIICRSELVANEDDLAAKIIGMSRLVKFDKGQVLMTHGEDADDVYFILFDPSEYPSTQPSLIPERHLRPLAKWRQ